MIKINTPQLTYD